MIPESFGPVASHLPQLSQMLIGLPGLSVTFPVLILVLAVILILPGYSLTSALFPRRELDFSQLLALTIGLSLATCVLGGLVLHMLPWDISPVSWAVWLGSLTMVSSVIAIMRRLRTTAPNHAALRLSTVYLRQIVLLAVAVLITVSAFSIAREEAADQANAGFTQFWLLPSEDTNRERIRIGARSEELRRQAYRVELRLNGDSVWDTAIELRPGETWEETITLNQNLPVAVDVYLFLDDEPDLVYRQLSATLPLQ